ncbi:HNH endonuclease signature motif containing protein [Microbacterium abyssi]|uniref:HNH endonuclease signature motif containing protein n=1 Tax=Microbacterium abyssi TaxID=2782166 RepID=UPI001886EAC8|nr:HNH endonuclease signature motif containing protein [Microbacterium sp. A18JL241]
MEQFFDDVDDRPRDAAFVIGSALDDLQCADIDLNRYAARRGAQIADAVALARRNPEVFVLEDAQDAADQAERAAVSDIALRLKRSEEDVQAELAVVQAAMRRLPTLWGHARDGFVSMYLVTRTVGALGRVRAPANATAEQQEAEREAARRIDEATSEWALTCSPVNFLRRLKRLTDRLDPEPAEMRHTRAVADRRVCVEHVDDGMSWINAYIPTTEALAVDRRLAATAKQVKKSDPCETRTIAQIRADLYSEWLRGVGTDRAAQTKIFVTIPVQLLDDASSDAVDLPVPEAEIVGHGPIDPLTAKQLLLDTGVFRRVIVDPIRSVVIDMDRRSRHATQAQRDWLILQHGTCARDGCTRLALDADIDHNTPWAQGGTTNLEDLRPLCPRHHVDRHRTRAIYRSRPDGTVEVTTPTGFRSASPPPETRATEHIAPVPTVRDLVAPF